MGYQDWKTAPLDSKAKHETTRLFVPALESVRRLVFLPPPHFPQLLLSILHPTSVRVDDDEKKRKKTSQRRKKQEKNEMEK